MANVMTCPKCGTKNRLPVEASGVPRCASCHTNLPWLVEAGEAEFDQAIDTALPVLVDLWAPWCGPCRMVAPGVEQAARQLTGRLKAVKVNVDEAPRVSARFDVQSIPTLLLLRNGKLVSRQVGALPASQLIAWARHEVDAGP